MITRLEALVDGLAQLNGWHDPRSEAYQLRNPLLLQAHSPKHEKDEKGRRVYKTLVAGYDNGLFDTEVKCKGRSRAGLTPFSTLADIVVWHGHTKFAARTVKNFIRAALKSDVVTETTPLGWFLEDRPAKTESKDIE